MPLTRRDWLAAAVLAGVAFAALAPALACDFVNFDDFTYVVRNPQVKGGLSSAGVRWAFTTSRAANWHPLAWLSLQLDATLFGPGPLGFHLTNVLLHAANAALLFLALRSLTGAYRRSAAVALLFAVHPLRAESVAWVSERKDVLSAAFGLLALAAYAGYARAPSLRRYLPVVAALALSLMAKPMLVTLPFLLLVLDGWPLRRARALGDWGKLAAEKLPLFAVVAASSAITVRAQAGEGAVMALEKLPLDARAGNAAVSYVAYLSKTVWPVNLAVLYPHPGGGLPAWRVASAALLLAALTAGAVALRGRAPYLLAGWLWFVGTLVPVIGLVQVGLQAYADRYTYFPQVGLLIAVCWGAADLAGARARAALVTAGVVAWVLAGLTWGQLGVWRDSLALWEHAVRAAGESPVGLANLGETLEERGRFREAETRYRGAVRLEPESVKAHIDLGNNLLKQGKFDEAAQEFAEVCRLEPDSPRGYTNLGNVYLQQKKFGEAARQFQEACRRAPDVAMGFLNLGKAEEERGDFARAAESYREALRLEPDSPRAHAALGAALLQQGNDGEGLDQLRASVGCDPRFVDGHTLLGKALAQRGELAEAGRHLEAAVDLDRKSAEAWSNLGALRFLQGRKAEAEGCMAQARELRRQPPGTSGPARPLAAP
jgi:tetratricopeptide (TPR) repeat protein